jgi:sugar lactone lactonase YvrE
MTSSSVLLEGLSFGEAPRWRGGRLWFSDFHRRAVYAVGSDGVESKIVDVPGQPSGLGWLPDGRLLVVSMTDRRVLRL